MPLRLFHCCCGEIQTTPTLRSFSRLMNPAEICHCVRNSQDTFVILNWHICRISRHPNRPTHQPDPAAEYIECYTLSAIFGFNQTMNLFGCSAGPPPHLAITLPPKRARFRTASAGPHQTAAVIDSLFQVTVFFQHFNNLTTSRQGFGFLMTGVVPLKICFCPERERVGGSVLH